jgi:hypothetical protein
VAQLCWQLHYPEDLLLAYKDSLNPGRRRRPSWETLKKALLWFSQNHRILLLIDALDECENREELLRTLCEIRELKTNINILVTSRPEADIEDAFKLAPRLRIEDREVEVNTDIQSYIEHRLESDSNLKKLPTHVKADIKDALINKSAGM